MAKPLPSRAITLKLAHLDYQQRIDIQVRTDANGRVDLGPLDAIDLLSATGTDIGDAGYDSETPQRVNQSDRASN